MKTIFIPTKYEGKIILPKKLLDSLPQMVVLAMPVQYLGFLDSIRKQLLNSCKKVILFKSRHGRHPGQILGCDIQPFEGSYDAFLYIGDGKFHPTALAYGNNKAVYFYNPKEDGFGKISVLDIEKFQKRKTGLWAKFLMSNKIGLILTTKPGQRFSSSSSRFYEELRFKLEKESKKLFLFLADDINTMQLENFNFIDVWINGSCPRLADDWKFLNLLELDELLKQI